MIWTIKWYYCKKECKLIRRTWTRNSFWWSNFSHSDCQAPSQCLDALDAALWALLCHRPEERQGWTYRMICIPKSRRTLYVTVQICIWFDMTCTWICNMCFPRLVHITPVNRKWYNACAILVSCVWSWLCPVFSVCFFRHYDKDMLCVMILFGIGILRQLGISTMSNHVKLSVSFAGHFIPAGHWASSSFSVFHTTSAWRLSGEGWCSRWRCNLKKKN